ncbi:MAG: MBL fold metallo-hydrolase [Smithella sp.]
MLDNDGLDKLNIIYDIFIDEENYDKVKVDFSDSDLEGLLNKDLNSDFQPGNALKALIEADEFIHDRHKRGDAICITLAGKNNSYLYHENDPWYPLFLAKKTRSIIQRKGSTNITKALDEVAEYLLYRLATINGEDDDEGLQGFGRKGFRTRYLNEISQCYLGYLSVGYADKALREYPIQECHYELLGLYNKALGLSHHEDRSSREKSLVYFDEVICSFTNNSDQPNLGYKYDIEIDLWRRYVYYPSLLHKAEVLIKLQRGQEAFEVLKILEKVLEAPACYSFKGILLNQKYLKCEYNLLMAQTCLESGKVENARGYLDNIDKSFNLISIKKRFSEVKYEIEMVKNGSENRDGLWNALESSRKLFDEQSDNFSEQAQAASYWLEAFQLALNSWKLSEEKEFEIQLSFFLQVIAFVNDHISKWLPQSEQIIENLSKVFEYWEKFQEDHPGHTDIKMVNEIKEGESRFCELQGKELGNRKPSCIRKIKSMRRQLLLNSQDHQDDKYGFPHDKLLEMIGGFAGNNIAGDFYTQRLSLNRESFNERLIYQSHWPRLKSDCVFTTLRKWQSFTPSLSSYSTSSRGGGYFLYKVGPVGRIEEGVVIDPGYDFVENFLEYGFAIIDINTILLTHSHIDHSADFRSLVTLFHEMNTRGKKKPGGWQQKKVRVILTSNCFDHFYSFIKDTRECIEDVIVVDPDRYTQEPVETKNFLIKPFAAYHKDFNDGNCVGFTIQERTNGRYLIGLSGDGVWAKELINNLQYCPVVCINIGALIDIHKKESFADLRDANQIKKIIYKENHLYLPGALSLIEQLRQGKKTRLVVVTELGEELRFGLRHELYNNLNQFVFDRNRDGFWGAARRKDSRSRPKIVIEDIGLTVSLASEPRVRCTCCQEPVKYEDIKIKVTEEGRNNEQIYYFCRNCLDKAGANTLGAEPWWRKPYVPQSRPSWTF